MSKKNPSVETDRVYCFCGNGLGIPGLPHEVSAEQAQELGLLEVLQAAVQNGNYELVETAKPAEEGE